MWNNKSLFLCLFYLIPLIIFSQKNSEKVKFSPEKTFHFKVGCNFNNLNKTIFKLLNKYDSNVFTPAKSLNYSPMAEFEFDNQFSKHIGYNLSVGFMQTRHNYHYESVVTNSTSIINTNGYTTDGLILCNIPHFNFSPSFYISNTRFNVGLGLYKYYFSFKPLSAGNYWFNLNAEAMYLYSTAGITQIIDIRKSKFTVSVNYYGFSQKFDNGFQLSIGLAI